MVRFLKKLDPLKSPHWSSSDGFHFLVRILRPIFIWKFFYKVSPGFCPNYSLHINAVRIDLTW